MPLKKKLKRLLRKDKITRIETNEKKIDKKRNLPIDFNIIIFKKLNPDLSSLNKKELIFKYETDIDERPYKVILPENFDYNFYITENKLKKIKTKKNAIEHYLKIGYFSDLPYSEKTKNITLIENKKSDEMIKLNKLDEIIKLNNLSSLNELLIICFDKIFDENIVNLKSQYYKSLIKLEFKDIILDNLFLFIENFKKKVNLPAENFMEIYNFIVEQNYQTITELNLKLLSILNKKYTIGLEIQKPKKPIIIIFSMIDYYFRIQRHQHIARYLSEDGYTVFYLKTTFNNNFNENFINPNLIEINLDGNNKCNVYNSVLTETEINKILDSIESLKKKYNFNFFISYIVNPFWYQVIKKIPNTSIIYDCADYHEGFGNFHDIILKNENELIEKCEHLILTSDVIYQKMKINRNYTLIRNGCEFDYFNSIELNNKNIIGYYGAISDWFDYKLVEKIAINFPNWQIYLIGNVWCVNKEIEKNIKNLSVLPNIRFFGEIPYSELKNYLCNFKIGIIPFVINNLIECCNPVKLYEMMALGIPVVLTKITDVVNLQNLDNIYKISNDQNMFIENIKVCIQELSDDSEKIKIRKSFAIQNSWKNRVEQVIQVIDNVFPLISIILLCFNNWNITERCINSIYQNSYYDNFEVIVIDNNSNDETEIKIKNLLTNNTFKNLRYIRNDLNYGFAKGMNIGTIFAKGEYIILQNNDTICSKEWLFPLIKNLINNKSIGIVSPITNNCGSEGKQFIYYSDYIDCFKKIEKLQKNKLNQIIETDHVPFFCPALRKNDFYQIGCLDYNYGKGGWEDDDYILRQKLLLNLKNFCIFNSFVFHEESFTLGTNFFNNSINKEYFEKKWLRPWKSPSYKWEIIILNIFKLNDIQIESYLQRFSKLLNNSLKFNKNKKLNNNEIIFTGNKILCQENDVFASIKNDQLILNYKKTDYCFSIETDIWKFYCFLNSLQYELF